MYAGEDIISSSRKFGSLGVINVVKTNRLCFAGQKTRKSNTKTCNSKVSRNEASRKTDQKKSDSRSPRMDAPCLEKENYHQAKQYTV
jgi:hypothetical protein